MPRPVKDPRGMVFSSPDDLALLECVEYYGKETQASNGKTRSLWKWRCSYCGEERVYSLNAVRRLKDFPCCSRRRKYELPEKAVYWAFHYLYIIYKGRHRRKQGGTEANFVSEDTFRDLLSGKCHYCGSEPDLPLISPHTKAEVAKRLTLDRVDSNLPYSPDNVVGCCNKCNIAKSDLTVDEFVTHIERIYNHTHKS